MIISKYPTLQRESTFLRLLVVATILLHFVTMARSSHMVEETTDSLAMGIMKIKSCQSRLLLFMIRKSLKWLEASTIQ